MLQPTFVENYGSDTLVPLLSVLATRAICAPRELCQEYAQDVISALAGSALWASSAPDALWRGGKFHYDELPKLLARVAVELGAPESLLSISSITPGGSVPLLAWLEAATLARNIHQAGPTTSVRPRL